MVAHLLLIAALLGAPATAFADDCSFGSCRCYGPNCDTGGYEPPPERPERPTRRKRPQAPPPPAYKRPLEAGLKAMAEKKYRKALKSLHKARRLAGGGDRFAQHFKSVRRMGKRHHLSLADDFLRRDKYGAALKQVGLAEEIAGGRLPDRVCRVYRVWAEDALRSKKVSRAKRVARRARKKARYCLQRVGLLRDLAGGAWEANEKAKQRAAFEASIRGDIEAALRAGKRCAEAFAGRRKLAVQSCRKRAAKLDAVERAAAAVADFITEGDVRFEVAADGFSRPVDAARRGARANKVVTGTDGWAEIPAGLLTKDPGRIVVGVKSAVVFLTDDKTLDLAVASLQGTIRWLHQGAGRAKALSKHAAKRRFKVSSGSACCGVRGTDFIYRVEGDRRTVAVIDGAVDVAVSGTTQIEAGRRAIWTAGSDKIMVQHLGVEALKTVYPIFRR